MITSVAHIALYCRNIEKSADFYTRVLGLRHLFTQKKPDGSLWYVYLHAGNRTFVELFPISDAAEKPSSAAPGVAHICLAVDDIHETASAISALNWPLEANPARAATATGRCGSLILTASVSS